MSEKCSLEGCAREAKKFILGDQGFCSIEHLIKADDINRGVTPTKPIKSDAVKTAPETI